MSGADVNSASDLRRPFPGDSEMAACMQAFGWFQTDLGSPETWPQNLRIALLAPIALQVNPYIAELLGGLPGEAISAPLLASPLASEAASHNVATPTCPHILLADDNADICAYVQRLLSSQYTVETVADGAAALAAAHDFLPHLRQPHWPTKHMLRQTDLCPRRARGEG
jgi:CheY-like chemotaxis protein